MSFLIGFGVAALVVFFAVGYGLIWLGRWFK